MTRISLALAAWTMLLGAAVAREPASLDDRPYLTENPPQQTESMWFYIQENKRLDDPKQAVRRKAEERSRQRRERIATMKRLGFSKQRPWVMQTPTTSFYGPGIFVPRYVPQIAPAEFNPATAAYASPTWNR